MTRTVTLSVNSVPIQLDYFVLGFLDHTAGGMVEALEGTEPVRSLTLSIDGDKVAITLNGKAIAVNAFVMKIVKSTMMGILSPLKGVTFPVNQARLDIAR